MCDDLTVADIAGVTRRDFAVTAAMVSIPADHGWCAIDLPVYNQVQADRAVQRILALFASL